MCAITVPCLFRDRVRCMILAEWQATILALSYPNRPSEMEDKDGVMLFSTFLHQRNSARDCLVGWYVYISLNVSVIQIVQQNLLYTASRNSMLPSIIISPPWTIPEVSLHLMAKWWHIVHQRFNSHCQSRWRTMRSHCWLIAMNQPQNSTPN